MVECGVNSGFVVGSVSCFGKSEMCVGYRIFMWSRGGFNFRIFIFVFRVRVVRYRANGEIFGVIRNVNFFLFRVILMNREE